MLDKKNKFILKKGYRFSEQETNYSSPLYLTKKYKEFLSTHGLTQIIEEPTRITDTSSSLLDHILVNTPDKITQHSVLSKTLSDHDIIVCTRKHTAPKTGKHNTINLRSLKNYTKDIFLDKLQKIKFPNYRNFVCVNDAYKNFLEKIMEVIDKIAPMKEIRIKGSSKAWFDGEVIERINVRDKLKKKFVKSKLKIDYDNFKNAQRQASQIVKRNKLDYIKNQLNENIAKPSKLWKTLKSIGLANKGKNEAKICLEENNKMFFEPKEVSRIFKQFYENLAQSLVDKLPPAPNKYNNINVQNHSHQNLLENLPFVNENTFEGVMDPNHTIENLSEEVEKDVDYKIFKKRGLHFVHINTNSILSKIEEVKIIADQTKAAVIGISESKLDETVLKRRNSNSWIQYPEVR